MLRLIFFCLLVLLSRVGAGMGPAIAVKDYSRLPGCGALVLGLLPDLEVPQYGLLLIDSLATIVGKVGDISPRAAEMYRLILTKGTQENNLFPFSRVIRGSPASRHLVICLLNGFCRLPGPKYGVFPLVYASEGGLKLLTTRGSTLRDPLPEKGVSVSPVLAQPLFFSFPHSHNDDLKLVLELYGEFGKFASWVDLVTIGNLGLENPRLDREMAKYLTIDKALGPHWDPGFVFLAGVSRAMVVQKAALAILKNANLQIWDYSLGRLQFLSQEVISQKIAEVENANWELVVHSGPALKDILDRYRVTDGKSLAWAALKFEEWTRKGVVER